MKNKKVIILIFLIMLFSSFFNPVSFGQIDEIFKNNVPNQYFNYDIYHPSEKIIYKNDINNEYRINQVIYDNNVDNVESKELNEDYIGTINALNDPPMDSPWPMYCHDIRHTGRSPYSTADNNFYNKWWFKTDYGFIEGSGVIDNDGVIYFGSWNNNLYAMYPNGILKWVCNVGGNVRSSPVIDEDGTIYIGTEGIGCYFYAINPDGTMKWRYPISETYSSPVIANDGSIIFTDTDNWYIKSIYPNGTLKWTYKTGHVVYSSPAIGDDGTVYCGCHDNYLYALYPDNGTLKWKYKLEDWVRTSPCIGDDGTIYVASFKLHALYPNGTVKWITDVGGGTSPTIGRDGTIYAGYSTLYAVNPIDGSVKWTFPVDGTMRGGTPCNSVDGTIFVGTSDGGELIAINPDGTLRWRTYIGTCEFAPIIGEDGTVYIGTSVEEFTGPGELINVGYLYAFNNKDPNALTAPEIKGPNKGKKGIEYQYTFKSTSPLGRDLYYYIEWGDGDWTTQWWIGPYSSGETVVLNHTWPERDVYTIRTRCKDTENLWGPWSEYKVSITPRNKAGSNYLFMRFLERFPMLERLLFLLK